MFFILFSKYRTTKIVTNVNCRLIEVTSRTRFGKIPHSLHSGIFNAMSQSYFMQSLKALQSNVELNHVKQNVRYVDTDIPLTSKILAVQLHLKRD